MINLGSIELPLDAVTKTFAILAKRGAGKSYTAGVMEEEFFKNKLPFVVFDPIDVHWGITLKKDRTQGYDVVVFGLNNNADIQLKEDMGAIIAQAVVQSNISCILSTFGLSKKGQRRLITDFSEELLRINDTPRHIFIEEAHEFVPQRVGSDMGRCFAAVEALVVMGRNRGLGVTLINQRAATINKDVLTQIDTLLAFRNVAPQDRKALQEWVEFHASSEDFETFWRSLPTLPTGEGWIWSPEWLNKFERIKIRQRETIHPDREHNQEIEHKLMKRADIEAFIQLFNHGAFPEAVIERTEWAKPQNKITTTVIPSKVAELEKIIKDKDIELQNIKEQLREAQEKLRNIRLALDGMHFETELQEISVVGNSVLTMWLDKIGRNNSAGKILSLLAEKRGLKFTKAQIRTMVGISSKSSGFASAMSLLRKNDLVRVDGSNIVINPELI